MCDKNILARFVVTMVLSFCCLTSVPAQHKNIVAESSSAQQDTSVKIDDKKAAVSVVDTVDEESTNDGAELVEDGEQGLHKSLKTKFLEGNAGFMSLVALALVLGLAFCIERIIYLSLCEINAKKFMIDLDMKVSAGDIEGARQQCLEARGPVAAICQQGLQRINDSISDIERAVASYGSVQAANLEKGCPWITLFIAIAPSLGFLGTVIGMVMAFDQIQMAGDINSTIVAAGMKVALITTIFGIIVAVILQVFYNYILSKIDHLTSQMEESTITLLDAIVKYKRTAAQGKENNSYDNDKK